MVAVQRSRHSNPRKHGRAAVMVPRATSSGKVLGFPIRSYAMVGTVRI
jgi:hypothetical protein